MIGVVSPLATIVRPAKSSDKGPLMEFVSRIWGGHDYVPRVWDEWMRERSAKTFVVEVDGRPVGMNRVKFLDDGSAWLEGARIHPAFRGTGLASALGRNSIRVAARRGSRVMRLVTNSRNRSARRQVAKMGFAEIGRMSVYNPGRHFRFTRLTGVKLAGSSDIMSIVNAVKSSREYKAGAGVFWDGFRATALTRRAIGKLVRERRVYHSGDAVAFFKRGKEGSEPFIQVCFACGDPKSVVKLIEHIFNRTKGRRNVLRYLSAPQGSPLVGSAKRAGLVRWRSFILFQRSSPNG
jgi:GNAT superfamily N-acetyltransferase